MQKYLSERHFSHDGNSYGAADISECRNIHLTAQKRTLEFARLAKEEGMELETVSIGSTPSMMHDFPILEGVRDTSGNLHFHGCLSGKCLWLSGQKTLRQFLQPLSAVRLLNG